MFGQGWIGCDFDGTLAVAPSPYDPTAVGAPIPKMVERVKAWLAEGKDVRIFTARVAYVSPELLVKIEAAIQKFCFDNLGKVLPVTCIKDHDMLELWDDRARQVELNTGVLIRSIPDSSLTSGTDRAMEFMRVIKQYTEAFGDPDNWPVDSRENMFEMLRSSLRDVVQKPFWSRLGIGYSNVSGQSFPEACALDAPHSLGPQGEPIYAEQGGVKRCVACECGGCIEHRYSEDQPRDADGKFGSGSGDKVSLKFDEWTRDANTGDRKLVVRDEKTGAEIGHIQHDAFMEEVMGTKMPDSTIRHVFVEPGYRKQGIGEKLYREAIKDAKSLGFKRLLSDTSVSEDAQHVWTKLRESGDFNITTEKDGLGREQWVVDLKNERSAVRRMEHRYSDDQPRDEHGRFGSGGTSAEHLDKQAAARPTDEQRDLRAGYKEAFDAAREKFTEIAGKYGVISGRVKDLNSIAQKMATNPNYTGKPLSELKDVAGLRCTCPNVAAVRDCVAALREQSGLKIVGEQENKMDTPQGFYRAIHEAFDSMGENKFGERVGEIQVRTERQGQIAMWGHDCAYKGPYKKDEEVQAYARAVSNAAWELDNGRPASYPEKVPAALAERDLAFKPEKTYTDDWLFKERGDKYWEQTS